MANAADRVQAYIVELTTKQKGLDKEIVHTMNDVELRTEDLRELVVKARAFDEHGDDRWIRPAMPGCSDCAEGTCKR